MIFHENHLLADDSHEISYLIFRKFGKMFQNLPSAAVVIGALRVNFLHARFFPCVFVFCRFFFKINSINKSFRHTNYHSVKQFGTRFSLIFWVLIWV